MEEDKTLFISGEKMDLSSKEKFLGEFVFKLLQKQPMDKQLQVILDTNEHMTFGELFQLGAQICQTLLQLGLEKEDIVTFTGYNSNVIHALFLGVVWAGGVPHPVGLDLKKVELSNVLNQVKPKWIFCKGEEVELISEAVEYISHDAKIVLFGPSPSPSKGHLRLEDILVEVNLNTFAPQKIDNPDNLALILCSSGTMGYPKCVGLSHNFLLNFHSWDYIEDMDFKKPYLLNSSFSWITGVYFLLLSCQYGSFRVVTLSGKPNQLLKSIQDYKLYGAMIPPCYIKNILDSPDLTNYDVSSLKEIWSGGSPVGEFIVKKFQEKWPDKKLCQCYGLTEAGGVLTRPAKKEHPTSAGRLLYNVQAKIQDPKTDKSLGPNAEGEICVRSDCLFKTYVGNEEAVKQTVKNGWLHTGDIGYYSEDGHLYITSRMKEIIKIDRHQVSPVEVENYIFSLPGVQDVGVSPIFRGDNCLGLMGLVAKSENSTITAECIIRKVEENLSPQKHLRAGVYFVDEVPRNMSGKIKRKYLSEMAEKLYNTNKA